MKAQWGEELSTHKRQQSWPLIPTQREPRAQRTRQGEKRRGPWPAKEKRPLRQRCGLKAGEEGELLAPHQKEMRQQVFVANRRQQDWVWVAGEGKKRTCLKITGCGSGSANHCICTGAYTPSSSGRGKPAHQGRDEGAAGSEGRGQWCSPGFSTLPQWMPREDPVEEGAAPKQRMGSSLAQSMWR